MFIDSLPAIASQPSGATCYDTCCAFLLQSSLELSVTIHGCASFSFVSLLEQQCYDTRCAFLLQAHWSKSVTICGCASSAANHRSNMLRHMLSPFLFAAHWSNVLRDTLCFHLQLKASMVCDSHFTRILCRYAVLFKSSSNTAVV